MTWAGPMFKPVSPRIERAERRATRKAEKAKKDRAKARAEQMKRDVIRRDVWMRDRGCCRVCGTAVKLKSDDVLKRMESHHVIYRSAGGLDGLTNEIATCARCHDLEHRHLIEISGDPNKTIRITVRHPESGRVVEDRESPCPL